MKLKECPKIYTFSMLALIIGLSFAFSACNSKAKLLARGESLLKERKFQEAKMQFRAVADIDKNSADAFWGMSRADEGLGNFFETIENLRQVVNLDGGNLDAKSKLGNYFLLLNPPQVWEAEKLLEEILGSNPNFIEGQILKASILSVKGKSNEEVIKILQGAISLDPHRIESFMSLARFYQKIENGAEAEKTIQKGITAVPSSAIGYMEYGRFLVFANREKEAESQYKKAIDAEPGSFEARESLASFYVSQKQFDNAEIAYKGIIEMEKNSPESRMILADFYALIGREEDSIATFLDILKDIPEYARASYRLGEIYLQRKELEKAGEQIENLLSINDTDTEALILRSRLKIQTGETEAAINDLEEVLKKQPSMKTALFFIAQAKLSLGQTDQARAFIGDLEKYHPNYLFSKLLHIQASFTANEPNKALIQSNELIDTVKSTYPNAEISSQGLEELRVRAITSRGLAYLQLNKLGEAKSDLQEVLKLSPKSHNAMLNLARVAIAAKNFGEAQGLFEKVLASDAKNFEALNGLIGMLSKQKQYGQAHSKMASAISANPDDKKIMPALYFLDAQVFIAEKNYGSAEETLNKAIELDESYLPAYSALASIQIAQNKADEALNQYKRIVAQKPDSSIYTLIAMLYDSKQNFEESEKNYREALKLNPDNPIASNNLAWNIAAYDKGNLDEALTIMQNLLGKNHAAAGFQDTLGWVYFKKGLYAPAVESLKKAVALDEADAAKTGNPVNAAYRIRLGTALASLGDKPNAKKEVEIALQNQNNLNQEDVRAAKNLLSSL